MNQPTIQNLSTSTQLNAVLREVVQGIFDEMLLAYGKRFVDMWSAADPERLADHWTLKLSGFTRGEIKRGVAALESRDWPPTLVEFKKMCRPSIDPEVAYHEAYEQGIARDAGKSNQWSSRAIFWAWRTLGSNVFREQSYPQLKGRWERALADHLTKAELPEIPEMVLAVGVDMKSTEINVRVKAEIEKQLKTVSKTPETKMDHLRWAKVVVERVARGDRRVPLFTLKAAQEALGSH